MTESGKFGGAHGVWVGKGALGYRPSIERAGTVAAPLLAGFSFTLLVLVLPTLGENETTVEVRGGSRVLTESEAFSALPEIAALLLLLAGLLLVASVQTAISMVYHSHTPSDYEEWYPEYFREGEAGEKPPEDLEGWSWKGVDATAVGSRWYGGWPRWKLHDELVTASKWAKWARWLYHAGIMALLLGLTFLTIPPAGEVDTGRWALFVVAAAGALGEAIWIAVLQVGEIKEKRRRQEARSQAEEKAANG